MKTNDNIEPIEDWQPLEERLRAAAPALPPALRARTMSACAAHGNKDSVRHSGAYGSARYGSLRLAWVLVGLWFFQWAIVAALDSQQAALLTSTPSVGATGSKQRSARITAADYADHARTDLWRILQARTHEYAALLATRSEQISSHEAG